MKQFDVQTMYPIVEPGTDSTAPGAWSLSAYVSIDYGGGSIVFAGDRDPEAVGFAHVEAHPWAAPNTFRCDE